MSNWRNAELIARYVLAMVLAAACIILMPMVIWQFCAASILGALAVAVLP